ncbi:hypothetical protein GLAREA_01838 [Glarea lozoyensis ATCC 20868]|uniref:Apple domain-containing protein n=1 Tax=Glarea lozoyensis (strain ATCC 20868 / MF5171) TaxID=1116229 RepID=S3D1L9_GLAL2|nr:uncharacterized protein GLAREA_01838 [Glarea lozoyensis ATCC 20868]EPE25926.1 hypothetical protein GLAREA_01838 [Glarea lozoyensis ATCC 20868]
MQLTKIVGAAALLATSVLAKQEAPAHRLQRYHDHNDVPVVTTTSSTTTPCTTSSLTSLSISTSSLSLSTAPSTFNTSLATPLPGIKTRNRKAKGHKLTISYSSIKPTTNTSSITHASSTASITGCSAPSTSTSVITITNNVTSTITLPFNSTSQTTTTSSTTTSTTSHTTIITPLPLTSVLPATVATGASSELHPSTSVVATTIVSGTPPGATANPKALHCGLHGLPVGDYFLAGFVENETSGRLDVWKCWRYCTSVFGIDMGCESYTFYPEEGTDAPRCDLYGGSVAQSLDSVNRFHVLTFPNLQPLDNLSPQHNDAPSRTTNPHTQVVNFVFAHMQEA